MSFPLASYGSKNVAAPEWKYAMLERAVRKNRNVWALYNGLPRLLSPHLLGSKAGELRLFSYQFGGKSKSGLHPPGSSDNFRCMRVRDLHDVVVFGGEWHTGGGGGKRQNCLDRIDVRHPQWREEGEAA